MKGYFSDFYLKFCEFAGSNKFFVGSSVFFSLANLSDLLITALGAGFHGYGIESVPFSRGLMRDFGLGVSSLAKLVIPSSLIPAAYF